jgi:hypothetical protein
MPQLRAEENLRQLREKRRKHEKLLDKLFATQGAFVALGYTLLLMLTIHA